MSEGSDRPAAILEADGFGRGDVALVEIFTASEQRARSSQAYYRSAVGSRLRETSRREVPVPEGDGVAVTQRDERSGLEVCTTLIRPTGVGAVELRHRVTNASTEPVVLTAISSATVGLGHSEADLERLQLLSARSEWLAEARWETRPLRELLPDLSLPVHGQDARGHWGMTSQGSWSAGEHLPMGVVLDENTGHALAWQVETAAGWHVDACRTLQGGVLAVLGPTDREHQFAQRLLPGESFEAVPVVLATSTSGVDGVAAELAGYRRWRRSADASSQSPVIYNDFMNTLMGQPTTEQLVPLIEQAAELGVELFCIDAGWFAEPAIGDWWATVGEWQEATTRFDGGLSQLIDLIHHRGMRSGLWLEPEVVGTGSRLTLPEEAFFQRFGRRVCEQGRYHLDFRHPAARAHASETVTRLVRNYGVSYFKLDYNINPGPGTDHDASSAGAGLLGHARAVGEWLESIQQAHPDVLFEVCSSGAMRIDQRLLDTAHLQSTSDQQDFRLYPPIAASAPLLLLPEQSGNWAYPAVGMSVEETVFTLVTGLSARLYLSGFLHELSDAQRELVAEAVECYRSLRDGLATAVPFWPLGLPAWDADFVCLGLRFSDRDVLFVWDRSLGVSEFRLPGQLSQIFPRDVDGWQISGDETHTSVRTVPGLSARVLATKGFTQP